MIPFIKSQAYGNDFLLADRTSIAEQEDRAALARAMCDRHLGVGADGLILYDLIAQGARMQLYNADGGRAEVSGNGLRCLATLVLVRRGVSLSPAPGEPAPSPVTIETDAGPKLLTPIERRGERVTFRAAMGPARNLSRAELTVEGRTLQAVLLSTGNPQCVIPGPLPAEADFRRLGAALEWAPRFPEGTNVEFCEIVEPGQLRILIWERGVGPTLSSGTGTCAAAAAAASLSPGQREFMVTAPGGTQRVEVHPDNLYLTGWAELVFSGEWPDAPSGAH